MKHNVCLIIGISRHIGILPHWPGLDQTDRSQERYSRLWCNQKHVSTPRNIEYIQKYSIICNYFPRPPRYLGFYVPKSSYDHYNYSNVIMGVMASQITSFTIVYSTVYSGADQRKKSKLRVTGLCTGNSPLTGEFPAQMASNAENVSIWWCNHCNWHHADIEL